MNWIEFCTARVLGAGSLEPIRPKERVPEKKKRGPKNPKPQTPKANHPWREYGMPTKQERNMVEMALRGGWKSEYSKKDLGITRSRERQMLKEAERESEMRAKQSGLPGYHEW